MGLQIHPADLAGAEPSLVAGIAAYRRHPWSRPADAAPVIWQEGGSRLLDHGADGPGGRITGPTLLLVPSLVNRAHVLDLLPERSLVRHLARHGVRPLLLDWGWPGPVERGFDLTDYVAGRLERAIAAAGRPVVLLGYCMGGLLALAAARRRPDLVRGLALLATPWDFHAGDDQLSRRLAAALPALEPAMAATGTLPVDALQALFALADAGGAAARYRGFADVPQDGERARMFVALEDWLNDGVPLASRVARECLGGWYGRNATARGEWCVGGRPVLPEDLDMPCFVALPSRDRVVPPASARALVAGLPHATVQDVAGGHIGMVVGAAAATGLWQPLCAWLQQVGG